MKNKEKLIDYGKDALIVLLLISAVFLLLKAVLYQPQEVLGGLGAFLGSEPSGTITETGDSLVASAAAKPCYVLVTTEDGSHYAAKYDGANKEKLLSQFSPYLGEALGSASSLERITESGWETVLGVSGVFFDYIYPQPLTAMASWLGTELSGSAGEHMVRRLYLGGEKDVLYLYYIDESSMSVYRCATALSLSSFSAKIAELPMGSAHFAFEMGEEYENLDPYFILSDEECRLRAMSAANPFKDGYSANELLALFEMNSRTALPYPESDGSSVYVDSNKTLRIDSGGKLSFSVSEGVGIAIHGSRGELRIQDCVTRVNSLVQSSIGASCGEATVGLVGISNTLDASNCTLYFGYFLDGLPVGLPGGAYAARAQISNGSVTRVDMYYRGYTPLGETLMPLPEKQVCAIAAERGGEPLLRYDDSVEGFSCSWVTN